jgi:hypothetical protein
LIVMRLRGRCTSWLTVIASVGIALPVFAMTGPSASGAPRAGLPPGLQPTQLNITNDTTHRCGEPEIAVNPKNPNNLVYFVMSNKVTYQCEAAGDLNCKFVNGTSLGTYNVPGWISTHVFVTFDRGGTWSQVNFPIIPAFRGIECPGPMGAVVCEGTDHSDLLSMGDPMVTVTADGTFYLGWDSMNLGFQNIPPFGVVGSLIDGGIAVSKSTDGGRTWSTPVLTGTGVDRPWMTTDLSSGTVYEASSGFVNGSMSTGNPKLPLFSSAPDRWVVSSPDGLHWTTPQELGGGGFTGAAGSNISAANGVLAATFQATTDAACMFFVSTSAPCTVFETSTDSGAHWTRHPVANLSSATGSILVAADPTIPGTYTVAALDSTGMQFLVSVTHDSGVTWSGPTSLSDDPTTAKYKAWINYSPDGVLGLAWRSVEPMPGADPVASAAADPAQSTDCGLLGCGLPPDDPNDEDPPAGPYNIWAATSNDAGTTFSQPLEISTKHSPTFDPQMAGGTDDTSVIPLSHQTAFIGWGDWRPGDVAGFFSAVKLQAFTRQ